ncbi:hypothetical protein SG34_025600 [Thalassomonas viridans]|uniref:Uncharacterized protein n=1 Tax=Thalassomonas viridans TaxID=137584 RepID=A0AAF0C8Y0_9GAMM|nr:hypothetical protein [Thalassomonas viridans]WDE04665.1 hypothetical protein SG34_025600 [Thalassomonas viridans]
MSTISNAAQIMVDKLVADLNSDTPLSAEDQLLVAKALDTMKNSTTFETALIAVVEEHFNTADAALTAAKDDINAAKNSIETQATNLDLIPGLQTSIDTSLSGMTSSLDTSLATIAPTVRNNISGVFNKHQIGFYQTDHTLTGAVGQNGYQYAPANVTSLDNYATKEFYCFLDFGNQTTTYRRSCIVRVKADGSVSTATGTGQFFASGSYGFCPFSDDSCRLLRYDSGTLYVQKLGALSWEFNKSVDYLSIYYDKSSKDLYCVSGGFLHTIDATDGFTTIGDTTFIDADAFAAWAEGEGHLRADSFIGYFNGQRGKSDVENQGSYFEKSWTAPYMGGYAAASTKRTGFDLDNGIMVADFPQANNFAVYNTAVTPINTTTTRPVWISWKGQAMFRDVYGVMERQSIDLFSLANTYHYTNQRMYTPVMVAFSHIHKCLISDVSGYDYYSSSSAAFWQICGLSFGR